MPPTHEPQPTKVLVDADACPVKSEIYRVTGRHHVPVILVANSRMRVPSGGRVELVVVGQGLDAADDWIVEQVRSSDVVITTDILLASRCLDAGARVLAPKGTPFTEDNVGDAVATRDLLAELRSAGEHTGGPAPLDKQARSRFLHQLDEILRTARR